MDPPSHMPESAYFNDNDIVLGTPPFQAVIVKTTPSPSPAPLVAQLSKPAPPNHTFTAPSRLRHPRRRRTRPTQGDWVLIRQMDPNRPDIAQEVSERALNSASESERDDEDDVDDMEDLSPGTVNDVADAPTPPDPQSVNIQRLACISLEPNDAKATLVHRDSVIDEDVVRVGGHLAGRRPSHVSNESSTANGSRSSVGNASFTAPVHSSAPNLPPSLSEQQSGLVKNGKPHISSTTSPRLRPLAIPPMLGPDKLPALQSSPLPQDGSAESPGRKQSLPSFRHLDDIARSATSEHDLGRTNGFLPHRSSISSVGQSPTSVLRQPSISSPSQETPFPLLSAQSSTSANGDSKPLDIFLKTGGASLFGATARRASHAVSENGPFHSPLHPVSSSESYYRNESLSPGAQPPIEPRKRHMSIDDALSSRVLPPPLGSGIQAFPSQPSSAFICTYPNCNAPPFQTQYLLNSHTNVHSQNRPHFCPVKECPRGQGGKGFKRKNEMIRHGLVHQSPGYVCPFCPDREHKYPRPDNLQRHVRVHHIDKDKDDALLRDVLAQRPEGGNRGRRRRISDTGRP